MDLRFNIAPEFDRVSDQVLEQLCQLNRVGMHVGKGIGCDDGMGFLNGSIEIIKGRLQAVTGIYQLNGLFVALSTRVRK